MYLEKTSSYIINYNLSNDNETGDERADSFDIASGING